jgi:hypothetical protein
MDGAKLVQHKGFVATFLLLPSQVERLAGVLSRLIAVSLQTTDLADSFTPMPPATPWPPGGQRCRIPR